MNRPFRRRVLYLSGFDPSPARRYREIFRRDSVEQGEISGYAIKMMRKPETVPGFGWTARGRFPDGEAETVFEILDWTSIIHASMRRSIAASYRQLLTTAWTYVAGGALRQMMRLRIGPVLAALYPIAVMVLQLLVAVGLAAMMAAAVHGLAGWWLALPVGAATVVAVLMTWRRLDRYTHAYYLSHDYDFSARDRGAWPPEVEALLSRFGQRLAEALDSDVDEVLVVGHSTGATLAISLVADAVRAERGQHRPALALMTLGHVVPMFSFLPQSHRIRADLALLSKEAGIFWLDVSAPGDACCFALCDPVAVTGVAGPDQIWPLVISTPLTQTLSPQRQKALRGRWFRTHFQYLHAFDRPGDYDYFAITSGPVPLARRFAGRRASPGRIALPVGRGLAS